MEEVFSPTDQEELGSTQPAPTDLVDWFQTHPRLEVHGSEKTTVGGLPAVRLDLVFGEGYEHAGPGCPSGCVPIGPLSSGQKWGALQGDQAKLYVVDVGDEKLVILASAPAESFANFIGKADGIIDSVEFAE